MGGVLMRGGRRHISDGPVAVPPRRIGHIKALMACGLSSGCEVPRQTSATTVDEARPRHRDLGK